jgi:TonB family protein
MPGIGGGGPTYANFLQAVKSDYARAWDGSVPDGATEANAVATASVTIARDGTVLSARIVRSSGKPLVDASVQAVLDRIRKTVPIPEDSKDKQRTVEINFRVNPRNLAG